MKLCVVKKADRHEWGTIQQLGRQTFTETFAGDNTEEDLQQYLRQNFSNEKVQEELATPESHFYIAREEDMPVGYLKLNTGHAQTELREEQGIEIERIYVKAGWLGKKIGQLLYQKALEVAEELGKSYIWLGVWEKNARAIRFYEKNGFVAFSQHIFKLGEDEQTDILMKKVLR